MIGVYGKNFTVYKYVYNEETRTSYPTVSFGDVAIDKNQNDKIELYVMDDKGNIMDGTPGSEIGTKILAVIPAGRVRGIPRD